MSQPELLDFATFHAHHLYPKTPPVPGISPPQSNMSIWADKIVIGAGAFAYGNFLRQRKIVLSHVRIQVRDEMAFWQYLTWLRHVGEPRFELYEGRMLGWIKLAPTHQVHYKGAPLCYLEITIAKQPQQETHRINRLVIHDAQLTGPIVFPAMHGEGDIRHQPNHAAKIFAALPPY